MRALRVLQRQGEAVRARVRSEIAAALGESPSEADLAAAADRAHALFDDEHARAIARPGARAPACSAGCAYCCHVHVDATGPEILSIAAHLARTRTPEQIHALGDRLAAHVARAGSMSDEDRWAAKVPCALLGEGGLCSVYEARPLRCRAFHARSVDPCRRAFEERADVEPDLDPALARAHDAVEAGFDEALAEAAIPAEGQRLEAGLLAVWTRAGYA
jgi:Fe-S-cluster containining protein